MRLLMSEPTAYSADCPNNALMAALPPEKRKVDRQKAYAEWHTLYTLISRECLVYLLPAGRYDTGLQDQVFVANLGCVVPEAGAAIVSRFSSHVRVLEERHGFTFFDDAGFRVIQPPFHFEGEAEMKRVAEGVYACGHGLRSDRRTYDWLQLWLIRNSSNPVELVPLEMSDPKCYHLDCSVFPVRECCTMIATGAFHRRDVQALEKHSELIDVPVEAAQAGACNMVRAGNKLFSFAYPHSAKDADRLQIRTVEQVAKHCALEPVYVDLTEFSKGGADLSCCIMHLDYQ
jgi:N-dimethylarginine dimethylaminohydrolase